uniref:Clathrin/coatomer adaptor adaptin-like N-terminal domain-containing protein n=1 Tax=Hyaloperonospora arabidopsidis (strain Emoy2) TaxID=559515 RepID=M4BV21_HYAAE
MVATTADLVVNGSMAQALDVCRRLLRTGSSVQCVETAQLVLERLRSGGTDDSSDDVNALLRLLGNYVTPTRELTEEILSLLLFCDHRELLVHHLPKLTYQSKECVELVVQAYLELLATDRSLLVPVLGSLAEMPLDNSEKNTVVEATQSLLDAAEEGDIPAVVKSLLSMVTKSSAPKALGRLRTECSRIQSAALLRLIRHVEPLTTFDILSLTLVMGKSAENELAVRTTTSIAQSGRIHGRLMREAAMMLVRPEWTYLLPSFVQFCSCLLATCFRASTRVTLASNLISSSVDSFIVLIETASIVHEEVSSTSPQRCPLI